MTEQPPYIPIKALSEKSAELAPEAVASLKVNGMRGQDLVLKAVVNSEDELVIPDENILAYPIIQPINRTVHELSPGVARRSDLELVLVRFGQAAVSRRAPALSSSRRMPSASAVALPSMRMRSLLTDPDDSPDQQASI